MALTTVPRYLLILVAGICGCSGGRGEWAVAESSTGPLKLTATAPLEVEEGQPITVRATLLNRSSGDVEVCDRVGSVWVEPLDPNARSLAGVLGDPPAPSERDWRRLKPNERLETRTEVWSRLPPGEHRLLAYYQPPSDAESAPRRSPAMSRESAAVLIVRVR